jgi:transposase
MRGDIALTARENDRVRLLTDLEAGRLDAEGVASGLGVSPRQVRRLLRAFRAGGAAGLAHGNRGRIPANACPPELGQVVADLAGTYTGFNQVHLTEKIAAEHGVLLSRSTVRRMLHARGIAAPKPQRRTRHRRRRVREPRMGCLLQLDASIHDWLEGRGPRFALVGAIDDATGHVWAQFAPSEDQETYFSVLREIVSRHGIPGAVYTDRHLMFLGVKHNQNRLSGGKSAFYDTQFSRLLQRLGTTHIRAGSPQAKGRIERLWKTLQDRLVSELRAEGVRTMARANIVLAKHLRLHNLHFAVPARETAPGWRPLPDGADLDDLFARVQPRRVANDNTVKHFGQVLQLLPNPGHPGWGGSQVQVHLRLDGQVTVYLEGLRLPVLGFAPSSAASAA